jgi:hypothetical protein
MIKNSLASVFVNLVVMLHFSWFRLEVVMLHLSSQQVMIGSNQKKNFGFQSIKGWELKGVLCKGEEKWIYRWDLRGNRCEWCRLWVTFSPCLSRNAHPHAHDETGEASNPGKDIEWIRDSRNVNGESLKKERKLTIRGLFVSDSCGCAQNVDF